MVAEGEEEEVELDDASKEEDIVEAKISKHQLKKQRKQSAKKAQRLKMLAEKSERKREIKAASKLEEVIDEKSVHLSLKVKEDRGVSVQLREENVKNDTEMEGSFLLGSFLIYHVQENSKNNSITRLCRLHHKKKSRHRLCKVLAAIIFILKLWKV